MRDTLLEVRNLKTQFRTEAGVVAAVDGVDFELRENETLGMVGESGCGKSVTALSVLRLIDAPGRIVDGEILFRGRNLARSSPGEMRKIRGNEISMIFQEPMTSLNPVQTIGTQITEALTLHQRIGKRAALHRAVDMLKLVGIPMPEIRVHEYPHQLSGGMRQRAMIAMALSCNPKLLIADEPTTALDVTIQAQILDLMRKLKSQIGSAVMIITHDMGVIAEMADTVVVMYAGKVVEYADVKRIFTSPRHPYTVALLESIPRLTDLRGRKLFPIAGSIPDPLSPPPGCAFHPRCRFAREICRTHMPPLMTLDGGSKARCWKYDAEQGKLFATGVGEDSPRVAVVGDTAPRPRGGVPLLSVRNLVKHFPIKGGVFRTTIGHVRAVDDISFDIHQGETFGLVGESGCGKTTTGRLVLRLLERTSGTVTFEGKEIFRLSRREMRPLRKDLQIVFQDPYASLNPRMTVGDILRQSFIIHKVNDRAKTNERIAELLHLVGLEPEHLRRYPHQFSGGQRQRIGVARAIALNPKLVVCDEPVSALDVSIQAQILNLLEELQQRMKLSYLFIAHDLSVVKHIADRVAVMYLGRIVELARSEDLFASPQHPYTEALLSAVPVPEVTERRSRIVLEGDVPNPSNPPPGCRFHTRCRHVMEVCRTVEPALEGVGPGHQVACHLRSAPRI
ncbi:MAG TPA: ABC transporter ATP-binding protein [Spirochaetia bacterium]|nr:ABC transporter ATP-binding protein [Spirochaetia bacterium]